MTEWHVWLFQDETALRQFITEFVDQLLQEWQVNNHSRIKMHYIIHHWHSRFKAKEWQVYRQYWLPMHNLISHRQKWQIGSHACMTHSCQCLGLNSKLCTHDQNDVVFYHVNSFVDEGLINTCSEMIILWMQQANPKLQSEWPWSRTSTYIVFSSDWQGWQGSSATKNNSQFFPLGKDHRWTSITSSTRLPMSSTHVHNK